MTDKGDRSCGDASRVCASFRDARTQDARTHDAYHFWLSIIVLVGGGYLVLVREQVAAAVFGIMGSVVGYWFGTRKNGNGNGSGYHDRAPGAGIREAGGRGVEEGWRR